MSDSIAFGGLAFRRRSDFIGGNYNTKRPSVARVNYTQGDTTGGGQSIVITGEHFRAVTAVTFGAAGNASYTISGNTRITATLPEMKFSGIPSFDGVDDFLTNGTAISTLLPNDGYFYWILFKAKSIVGTSAVATGYENDTIFIDSQGLLGTLLRLDGDTPVVQSYHWDGSGKGNEHVITIGKWHCLCVRFDGSTIHSSLDGGTVSTVAASNHTGGVGTLQIGSPYVGGSYGNIDIAEIGMIGSAQTNALFTSIVASLNYDYNLNLGGVNPASMTRSSLVATLLLQDGDYDPGGTWSGAASAGSSYGRNASEVTNHPTWGMINHEALVRIVLTNNVGESDGVEFEYWDPTVDGTTRVLWDSYIEYTDDGTWYPRYIKPRVNTTYGGSAENFDSVGDYQYPAPAASNAVPVFTGDGMVWGLQTFDTLEWQDVLGAASSSTHPGTIVLVQKYLETTGQWSGPNSYNNDAFIGEHAVGSIGLGGEYDGDTPVVAGHVWHPSLGYKSIKVPVASHGDKMMVFSRFGANGSANFGVGVNGDTSGSTYSETIHTGGTYTSGVGSDYVTYPIDFGYKYDGATSTFNQTTKGVLYTAVIQDARASDATITKFYKWTQQRFGVGASDLAPEIDSINYTLGDSWGGGQYIVITGTNLDTVNYIAFGDGGAGDVDDVEVTGESIIEQSATELIFELPECPGDAGIYMLEISNDYGTDAIGFEYWDPTEIANIHTYLDSDRDVDLFDGPSITAWTNQVSANDFTSPSSRPQQISGVFGPMPAVRAAPTCRVNGSGMSGNTTWSYFAVAKWTSSDTTSSQSLYNPPLTLFGGSGANGFGASGGSIAYVKHDAAIITGGSGYNDGNPHLIGVTGDATPTIKLYVGETQVGATATPGGTAATYFDKVLGGYDPSTAADGWNGDVGALIAISGVISADELAKLNLWAKQRFGTND